MKLLNIASFWPLLLGLLIGAGIGAALGYFGQCTSGTCPLTSTWWRGALYGGLMGVLVALTSAQGQASHQRPGANPTAPENPPASADGKELK